MRGSADDVRMTYVPADDVWMTYMPVDDVQTTYLPADNVPDDVPDDICYLPAKSPTKSHSRVIRMSSAHHLHVVRTRFQPQKYFHLKSRQLC